MPSPYRELTDSSTRGKRRDQIVMTLLQQYNVNNNDIVLNSVIAWSFYPKLLRSEGKLWRNVANNQSVKLHPTSVNKTPWRHHRWLSFYHIMQSSNKAYNAHETSPVEDFAIALVCGDAEFKVSHRDFILRLMRNYGALLFRDRSFWKFLSSPSNEHV